MPLDEPRRSPSFFAPLTTDDLITARETLLQKRLSGVAYVRYADGSGTGYRSDAEIVAALGAIETELAHRQGGTLTTTILVAASKGLDT